MPSLDGLLIVVAVAFAAPFLLGLAPACACPPSCSRSWPASWSARPGSAGSSSTTTIAVLATLGLGFLLFLGGLEVDFERCVVPSCALTAGGFAVSFALAVAVAFRAGRRRLGADAAARRGRARRDVTRRPDPRPEGHGADRLAARAVGDRGRLDRRFRRDHPALAVLRRRGRAGRDARADRLAAALAAACSRPSGARNVRCASAPTWCGSRTRRPRSACAGRSLLLVGFAAAAQALGLEVILGAFAAGAIVSLADPDGR